jgi:hypothetical protein
MRRSLGFGAAALLFLLLAGCVRNAPFRTAGPCQTPGCSSVQGGDKAGQWSGGVVLTRAG